MNGKKILVTASISVTVVGLICGLVYAIKSVRIKDDREKTSKNNNPANTKTKEEIMAIKDGVERRKAIAENPGLFGLSSN